MSKTRKKWLQVLTVSGTFALLSGTLASFAKDVLYTDDNVSISAAIDKCIEAGEEMFDISVAANVGESVVVIDESKDIIEAAKKEKDEEEERYIFFTGKAVVMADGYVNIRDAASTSGNLVGTILPQGIVEVEEQGDEWSLITSGECKGYIHNDYLMFGKTAAEYAGKYMSKKAFVVASALSLRETKQEDAVCLATLPNGCGYDVIESGDEWTAIKVDDTLKGFVKSEYIEITYNTITAYPVVLPDNYEEPATEETTEEVETPTTTETPTTEETTEAPATTEEPSDDGANDGGADKGVELAEFAKQYVGYPYVWGGTSLTEGADCSGFVMTVFKNFNYSLPRTADDQSLCGKSVSQSNVRPGDLVFYDYGTGVVQHVAIYIGNGQIVHAANTRSGIIVSAAFYNTPIAIRRIIY